MIRNGALRRRQAAAHKLPEPVLEPVPKPKPKPRKKPAPKSQPAAPTPQHCVEISEKIYSELQPILEARGLKLEEVVRLYLRSMVTASSRSRALKLLDEMPFGKYEGELVEVVTRADPRYINWLIANTTNVRFDPGVLAVLEEAQAAQDAGR